MSDSSAWLSKALAMLGCRERVVKNAGEMLLELAKGERDGRAENLRSNGCKAPGLCKRDPDSWDAARLLDGDDRIESC